MSTEALTHRAADEGALLRLPLLHRLPHSRSRLLLSSSFKPCVNDRVCSILSLDRPGFPKAWPQLNAH